MDTEENPTGNVSKATIDADPVPQMDTAAHEESTGKSGDTGSEPVYEKIGVKWRSAFRRGAFDLSELPILPWVSERTRRIVLAHLATYPAEALVHRHSHRSYDPTNNLRNYPRRMAEYYDCFGSAVDYDDSEPGTDDREDPGTYDDDNAESKFRFDSFSFICRYFCDWKILRYNSIVQVLIPPPFFRVMEELLLLFIEVVSPYFFYLGARPNSTHLEPGRRQPLADPRFRISEVVGFFGDLDYSFYLHVVIPRRWLLGLMREGQIAILETIVRKMIQQISGLLEVGFKSPVLSDHDAHIEGQRILEFARICDECSIAIYIMFGSKRFRSERLELLMMKYLDEDKPIKWELVRTLDEINRIKYISGVNMENQNDYQHYWYWVNGWSGPEDRHESTTSQGTKEVTQCVEAAGLMETTVDDHDAADAESVEPCILEGMFIL